jgi:hypothetical protein
MRHVSTMFTYGSCSGNNRVAVAEYGQWYPPLIIPHRRIFKVCTELWGRLVPSHDRMQNLDNVPRRRWCFRSSAAKPSYKHAQNFQDDCCSTDTGMKNSTLGWFLSVSPPMYISFLPGHYADHVQFCEWL